MKIKNLKGKLFTLSLLAIILVAYYLLHIPCPMLKYLNIPCPGCGMSRAYFCLMRLDVVGAFRFHSMFWAMPVLLLYYLKDMHLFKNRIINGAVLIFIGVGFLINWLFA